MARSIVVPDINMGAGKAGALSTQNGPPPVPVNEHVHVSTDKPYTLRLDIATMDAFATWCKARDVGKGPEIARALQEYMTRHGDA